MAASSSRFLRAAVSSPAARSPLASLLFFTTGATALAYQVIWFKRFSHLWGNSSLAMAGVVAGFLLGLGIGARLLSPLADRVRAPLRVYGLFELVIAGLSLAVPFEMELLARVTQSFHHVLEPRPVLHALVRLAAAALALGPPCVLMGATLPLLVRQFTTGAADLGRATAWFYAINTTGAAAGCYLTGFHLLPLLGLRATHLGAVALNVVVALLAMLLGRALERARPSTRDVAPAAAPVLSAGLRAAALLAGLGALVLQMTWARQLAMTLGGTTYAFTAVVLVVLVGIGLGSLILRLGWRPGSDPLRWMVITTLVLVAGVLAGQAVLPWVAQQVGSLRDERADVLVNALLCVGASGLVELVPSTAAGVLFPLLVHLTGAWHGAEGRAVGRVYAWNTVGTTLGATLPTLVLFPLLGTKASIVLALFAYLTAPVLFFGRALLARPGWTAALAVAAVAAPLAQDAIELRSIHYGQFLYGAEATELLDDAEVLMHQEGSVCDVLVLRYAGHNNLRVNGKVDASTYDEDQVTQLGTAYLPRFLRPDAAEILVVGYGSGASAGASLLFPSTRRVTCLEIEPAVYAASPHFASINHSPESSPRFELIVDDGRSHLMATDRRYDLILTEPSNPWMAGVANLFTLEFYRAARQRLTQGGILGQWMQTYSLSAQEYSLVVRTLLEVFPECGLLMLSEGDTLLLASDTPLVPDAASLEQAQRYVDRIPAIGADLERYFDLRDARTLLFSRLLMGTRELRAFAASAGEGLHTDWNMRLEFEAPLRLFERRADDTRLSRVLLLATSQEWVRELAAQLGDGADLVLGYRHLAALHADLGDAQGALRVIDLGRERRPEDLRLEADRLYFAPERDESWIREALTLVERGPNVANRLAVQIGQDGDHEHAITLLEPLLRRFPASVTLWTNLAVAYDEVGRRVDARAALARALALDPSDEGARELERTLSRPRVKDG